MVPLPSPTVSRQTLSHEERSRFEAGLAARLGITVRVEALPTREREAGRREAGAAGPDPADTPDTPALFDRFEL